jgi:hypothetical protein
MTKPKKVQTPGSYRLKKKEKKAKEKKRMREKKQQGEDKQTPKKTKRKVGRPSLVAKKSSSRKGNYRSRYVMVPVPYLPTYQFLGSYRMVQHCRV